jgi:hypothetical protein
MEEPTAETTNRSSAQTEKLRLHASTYVVLLLTAVLLFLLNVPGGQTVQFGLHPYEPWREPSPEDRTAMIIRAYNSRRIMNSELLVHGWPTTWLVRDRRWYKTSGGWRDTKVWSFSEDLLHSYPARLALNIVVSLALMAAVGIVFERWRRRRRHLWQQTIRDWLGFIAVIAAAIAIGLKTTRDFRDERAALNEVGRGIDPAWLQGLRETQGDVYQSAGPYGLPALLGRRWLGSTVQLDVAAEHLEQLTRFPHLRALRIEDVRLGDPRLSVLAGLKKLELLFVERSYPTPPPGKDNSGPNDDRSSAQLLAWLHELPHLEVLRLDNCAVGDESARAIADLQNLRILVLDDAAALTDDGLAAIAECKNLEVLDLRVGKAITSAGVQRLSSLASLLILKLDGSTSLDDSSIDALKTLTTLEEFEANCSAMSAQGIERFAQLPHLRRLKLINVPDDSAVVRLQAKRPDMHIQSASSIVPAQNP